MNREVELVLSGLHDAEGTSDKDVVETAQTAQYFKRNDSHYLLYEEDMEGFDGICKSRIKFRDNLLELTRQGAVEMHMIFEENKRDSCCWGLRPAGCRWKNRKIRSV